MTDPAPGTQEWIEREAARLVECTCGPDRPDKYHFANCPVGDGWREDVAAALLAAYRQGFRDGCESLERATCDSCSFCGGTGFVVEIGGAAPKPAPCPSCARIRRLAAEADKETP